MGARPHEWIIVKSALIDNVFCPTVRSYKYEFQFILLHKYYTF
jgi:hypothetical protein